MSAATPPPASSRPVRMTAALDLAPSILVALAEGAWVAAIYAVVQAAAGGPAPLGPVAMGLAALTGMLVARRWGPGLGDRWPTVALAGVVAAGAIGWLVVPAVLGELLALDPDGAARAHPGGWLAGLAFFRGTAHARAVRSDEVTATLIEVGLPGLILPVLAAGMLPEPERSAALGGVTVAVVAFLVAGTLALAVTRISAVGRAAGFDWRRNRAWLGLVTLLAVGVVVAALPAAVVVGPAVRVLIALFALPVIAVGTLAGLGQVRARTLIGLLVLAVVLVVLAALAGGPGQLAPEPTEPGGIGGGDGESTLVTISGGGLLVVLVIVGILVLARLWMREALGPVEGDVAEERTIDTTAPVPVVGAPGRRGRRRTAEPVDAAGAYLALLVDLEPDADRRRRDGETPAEHADRLRRAGLGAFGIDLLAADYELVRFAGRPLRSSETRRALDRWRRLRRGRR